MPGTASNDMSPADRAGSSSATAMAALVLAAVLVLSSSLHLAAGARVAVQPSRGGGGNDLLSRRRRDDDIAGAGACALAVTPLGYPCEEHQVRSVSLRRVDRSIRCTVIGVKRIQASRTPAWGEAYPLEAWEKESEFCAWRHAVSCRRSGLIDLVTSLAGR